MRFSLMTEPQIGGTYDQLLAAALWAESNGLVSFARSDHYYSNRSPRPEATDAFATTAGLARDTSSVRLCILVSPITFRHPAVIAKTAATIDQMAGGRLDLGIGTGWMELEHEAFGIDFPAMTERYTRLEESLDYIAAAFAGRSFEGSHYRLEADALPRPADTRLVIGGSGAVRTPTLAGRKADEYNHFVAAPEVIGPKVTVMREAAEAIGRDPADVEVTVMGPIMTGADESDYRSRLAEAATERDETPTQLEERWRGQGIPTGPPELVAEQLAELAAVGVDRYYLQWLDLDDMEGLDGIWRGLTLSR